MFTRSGDGLAFDSVKVVEGKFFINPSTSEIDASIELTYMQRESGATYGKCTIRPALFSEETTEAFRKLLECIEKDYGSIVFQQGGRSTPAGSSLGAAESEEGVTPKSLGGV